MQKITPFLWFDDNAEEAVKFYISIFNNSKIGSIVIYGEEGAAAFGRKKGTVMTIEFSLNGQKFTGLNGGPVFKFTPAISLFVYCKTERNVDELFKKLSDKGEIMMPLGKYPFSEKYAFLKDKFGVAWQIMLSPAKPNITPSLLFVGNSLGKAKSAVEFYSRVFKISKINHIQLYEKGENGKEGTVMHSSFDLFGQEFVAMDGTGPHNFAFNESISFVVNCKDQKEIDYYWNSLSKGGQEVQCGWLKDKFGISWQIVPISLAKMISDKNPDKSRRVMAEILTMKKLDLKKLENVFKKL